MSKRGADGQGGEERYGAMGHEGGPANTMPADRPMAATAAQMAKRKIASIKGRNTGRRTESPTPFGGSTQAGPPVAFNTNAPSSFNFGAQQPQQQQQSFGGFGESQNNAPSTSFTFGAQPQQNSGSNPFAGFGQQNQQNGSAPSNPFGGFGQQNQTNGGTPSNSFTFGAQPAQPQQNGSGPTNPFPGFGQQPQQNGAAPPNPFSGFGSQQPEKLAEAPQSNPFGGFSQQKQAEAPTPTPSFTSGAPKSAGEAPKPASTNGFSFGNTAKAAENPFAGFGKKPSATPEPAASNIFNNKSFFDKPAENPKADGWSSFKTGTPAAEANGKDAGSGSVLSGWQSQQASQPFAGFKFDQSQVANDDDEQDHSMLSPEKQTPKAPAGGFGFTNGTSNLFSGSTAKPPAPAGKGLFESSTAQSPAATPAAGKSLFDRITPADSAATPKAPASTSNIFGFNRPGSTDNTDTSTTPKAPAPSGGLFDRIDTSKPQSQESQTPAPKSNNLFSGFSAQAPPATAPPKNLFSAASNAFGGTSTPTPAASKPLEPPATAQKTFAAPEPGSKPSFGSFAPSQLSQGSTAYTSPSQQTSPPTSQDTTSMPPAHLSHTPYEREIRKLNAGLLARCGQTDQNIDWSKLCEYYLAQAKKIDRTYGGKKSADSGSKSTPASNTTFAPKPSLAPHPESLAKQQASGPQNLFAAQTPKPAPTGNLFDRVPSTAPVNKRKADDSGDADSNFAPATEKRSKPNGAIEYPKLPANASNTAKLFEAALDKPAAPGGATPSTKSLFAPKPAEAEKPASAGPSGLVPLGGFKPASATPQGLVPLGGFKPTIPTPAASTGSSSGGFKPSFGGSMTGTLSAFGQNAVKAQEEARKKARDEDFDSEDDDPEEWEKEYAAKQAEKKAKVEAAAKGGSGFSFNASSATTNGTAKPAFTGFAPVDKSASPTVAASEDAGSKTPASKSTFNPSTTFSFGAVKATEPDKKDSSADEDHTWKQGTPIKFGGEASTPAVPSTAPAKPGSLFANVNGGSLFPGSSVKPANSLFSQSTNGTSTSNNLFSIDKSSQPSPVFSFSKPASSTPAPVTTNGTTEKTADGEDAAGDDEDATKDPQMEDKTALQPSELKDHEILFHVEKAKAYKLELKEGADKKTYNERALGPLTILMNTNTNKTRVLLKMAPMGKIGLNFNVLNGVNMYNQSGKRVTAAFVDHINEKEPKGPSQWYMAFGKEEDAKEVARILKEEAAKA